MRSKIVFAGGTGVVVAGIGLVMAIFNQLNLAVSTILIVLIILLCISCIVHREVVRRNAVLLQFVKTELRENRLILKEIRNIGVRDSRRMEKKIETISGEITNDVVEMLNSNWSLPTDGFRPAGPGRFRIRRVEEGEPTSSSYAPTFRKLITRPLGFAQARIRSVRDGVMSLSAKGHGTERSATSSVSGEETSSPPVVATTAGISVLRPASPVLNGNPEFNEKFLFKSSGPKRRQISDATEFVRSTVVKQVQESVGLQDESFALDESHFERLTERIENSRSTPNSVGNSPRKHRVLIVTSNGAGLGHLTRMSAVERWLDADTLIYTMSSAYHRLGKSAKEIMYFPSHGDLGMNGKQWNILMESNFSAVVKGFQPDAIVFDGTYVYRGVIGTARKFDIPLIWMQRGCWKDDVDKRSKQRHKADAICQAVIVPGDYGCLESVHVGAKFDPTYVAPITLNVEEDLLSRSEARELLGLPAEKKLFLVQLGAGVINDIGDLRTTVVRSVQELGPDWEPVLVRNPLSGHQTLPEVLSIQAFPLGLYYRAFDAGAFAAGYNTVQESVALQLPGLFIPNLATKTDDQVHRAQEIGDAGLGVVATNLGEVKIGVSKLADDRIRSEMVSRMRSANRGNGAREAAQEISAFIQQASKTSKQRA